MNFWTVSWENSYIFKKKEKNFKHVLLSGEGLFDLWFLSQVNGGWLTVSNPGSICQILSRYMPKIHTRIEENKI
jgi:hypothetical protein